MAILDTIKRMVKPTPRREIDDDTTTDNYLRSLRRQSRRIDEMNEKEELKRRIAAEYKRRFNVFGAVDSGEIREGEIIQPKYRKVTVDTSRAEVLGYKEKKAERIKKVLEQRRILAVAKEGMKQEKQKAKLATKKRIAKSKVASKQAKIAAILNQRRQSQRLSMRQLYPREERVNNVLTTNNSAFFGAPNVIRSQNRKKPLENDTSWLGGGGLL